MDFSHNQFQMVKVSDAKLLFIENDVAIHNPTSVSYSRFNDVFLLPYRSHVIRDFHSSNA